MKHSTKTFLVHVKKLLLSPTRRVVVTGNWEISNKAPTQKTVSATKNESKIWNCQLNFEPTRGVT